MKVSASDAGQGVQVQGLETLGDHMHHRARALDLTRADDGGGVANDGAELLVDLRPDHEVGDTAFILDGDEDHAGGGAGALAHEHQSGNGDAAFVGGGVLIGERAIWGDAERVQLFAHETQWMGPEREPRGGIILGDFSIGRWAGDTRARSRAARSHRRAGAFHR